MSYTTGMQQGSRRATSDLNDFPALGSGQQISFPANSTSTPSTTNAQPNTAGTPTAGTYAQASTTVAPPPGLGAGLGAVGGAVGQLPNGTTMGQNGQNLRTEDFPALGVGVNGKTMLMSSDKQAPGKMSSGSPPPGNLINQHPGQNSISLQPHPSNQSQSQNSPFPQHLTTSSSWDPSAPVTKPIQQVVHSPVDKWGLAALLQLIRTGGSNDQLALSLGEDLARIGLDMGGTAPLYPTFIAPWAEPDQLRGVYLEEEYRIPQCYNVNTPALNKHKLTLLSDETLFYAFYSSPGDQMQIHAAHELYSRQWRYHKQLGVWLTKEPGIEPIEKGPDYERGTYIIFDPNQFTRVETPKDFHLIYDLLEDRPAFVGGVDQTDGQPQPQQQPQQQGQGQQQPQSQSQPQQQMQTPQGQQPQQQQPQQASVAVGR